MEKVRRVNEIRIGSLSVTFGDLARNCRLELNLADFCVMLPAAERSILYGQDVLGNHGIYIRISRRVKSVLWPVMSYFRMKVPF